MAVATTLKIGQWVSSSDSFSSHPASPTGAVFDLNDGTIFSLVDKSESGTGLQWSPWQPQAYTTSNPHLTGSPATKITHTDNRELVVNLVMGQGTLYGNWIANLHNLATLCAGITPNQPAALLIQPTGSSTPTYADVVAVKVLSAPYEELKWIQFVEDEITLVFTIAPLLRGAVQTLQNLVVNPGFENHSGPAVTVFNDNLSNLNAYMPQAYTTQVKLDSPARYYHLDDATTTATDSGSQATNGTYSGGYTQGQAGAQGGADLAVLFDGTSGTVSVPTTGFTNGNINITFECLVNFASNPSSNVRVMHYGNGSTPGQYFAIGINTSGQAFANAGGTSAVSSALSTGVWHHLVGVYNGSTVSIYADNVVTSTTYSSLNIPSSSTTCNLASISGGSAFYGGTLDEAAIYFFALSAARVTAHFNAVVTLNQDKFTYLDAVLADAPLRYYRLDEASGTTARDAMFSGVNGTYTGTVTYGVTGALTSDPQSDTAVTLDGSTAYITTSTSTGLPTGNAAHALDCWVKIAANPAATAFLMCLGNGNSATAFSALQINTSGHAAWGNGTSLITAGSALSLNTWHHIGVNYDGTTATLMVDGLSAGTATPTMALAYSTVPLSLGVRFTTSYSGFLSGSLDECAVYGTGIGTSRLTAHYNAGHNAPSASSNTLSIPSGGRVGFGSPAWSNYNLWQVRWRWITGMTAQFYLHYTDSNDYVLLQMSSTTLALSQVVGGVSTPIASSSSVNLTNGMQYWMQITQFSDATHLSVTLLADKAGSPNASIVTLTGTASGGLGAVGTGQPQLAASGAALAIGGNFSNVQRVQLFGPGGWYFVSTGTGTASGAWDQNTANTYSGGVTSSYGAGRIDGAPAGTQTAYWANADESSATSVKQTAMPVTFENNTFAVTYALKTSSNDNTAVYEVTFREYDANGNFLIAAGNVTTPPPAQNTWAYPNSGTYTTSNANTAYVVIHLQALTPTNTTVWWDNVQVWDQSGTGQTTMPYCELRGPQGPFQWMVSGITGDAATTALTCIGTYESSWTTNSTLSYYCGRRLFPSAQATLVTGNVQANGFTETLTVASSAYGGVYMQSAAPATGFAISVNFTAPQGVSTFKGGYHLIARAQSSQATIANVAGYNDTFEFSGQSSAQGDLASPSQQLFTAASTWTAADFGRSNMPFDTLSGSRDLSTLDFEIFLETTDSTGGGSTIAANWAMLLPVDTEVLLGQATNGSGNSTISNSWVWICADGLTPFATAHLISTNSVPQPNAKAAYSGSGTNGIFLVSTADGAMKLDPGQRISGTSINQGVACITDQSGNVLSCYLEFKYAPKYFFPQ